MLTMDGYQRMTPWERDEFHAWMKANDLDAYPIVCGKFGEGVLEAEILDLAKIDRLIERGVVVDERWVWPRLAHTFTLATPPPGFVHNYAARGLNVA